MNIYEKVMNVTKEFQDMNVKKTGVNKYVGYNYFDLSDIAAPINNLLSKYKMMIQISYEQDYAQMRIINVEKPDEILEYRSPMPSVTLKGAHDIQNLGAQQTYMRRYLLMTAFNIVENDFFDATQGKEEHEIGQLKEKVVALGKKIKEELGGDKNRVYEMFPELRNLNAMNKRGLTQLYEKMSR